MINKKLTVHEEINFFCEILENLNFLQLTEHEEINFCCEFLEKSNFFNNPDSIEKDIKKIGLIYSMNCLFDAETNDMLAFDIWDGNNFSEDAKFAIATYILNYGKQI